MARPFQELQQFLRELKRRNVYKVAATYAVVGFILIQVADLTFVRLGLPSWTVTFLIVLVAMGFPLALIVAWAFEVTPEGVRRTGEAEPSEEGTAKGGRGLSTGYKVLVGIGLVGAAVAGGWYLTGGGGGAGADDRSIAVLPFDALGEGEPGTFTEGMHDALLTRLSNVSDLTVISRTAVQQYRDTDKTTGEIARELGVRWVLEGGVQEMGDQIQVNAQLIDPRTEGHKWADSYRRDLTAEDLFAIQTEITKKIARSLEAELSPAEAERVERQSTGDLEAYRLYVKGRSQLNTRSPQGLRRAVDYFQRAIHQDSTFALAWAGLADVRALYPAHGSGSLSDSVIEHEAAARRGLRLDPDLAEARASMGFVHIRHQNGPGALRELQRALELKPSYAQAHHWLAWVLLELGQLDSALEHGAVAVNLNPRHPAALDVRVATLVASGRAKRAEAHARQLKETDPYFWSAFLYHTERWSDLAGFARRKLESEGGSAWRFYLARIALLRGDTTSARSHLAAVTQQQSDHFAEGLIHAALGETEAAFSVWREIESWPAVVGPAVPLRYRAWFPDILGPLRDDPRYQELIRRANEKWGLNPDGSLPDSVDVSFEIQSDE